MAVDTAFNSLFYGAGSYFGLTLMIILFVGLVLKWKYAGGFTVPIMFAMTISYLDNNLGRHALIMGFATVFILYLIVKDMK